MGLKNVTASRKIIYSQIEWKPFSYEVKDQKRTIDLVNKITFLPFSTSTLVYRHAQCFVKPTRSVDSFSLTRKYPQVTSLAMPFDKRQQTGNSHIYINYLWSIRCVWWPMSATEFFFIKIIFLLFFIVFLLFKLFYFIFILKNKKRI